MRNKEKNNPEINSSSMADIAFLLLIFFLVTTTIVSDKGLFIPLPPDPVLLPEKIMEIHERNLFKIQINSADAILVEDEPMTDVTSLKESIKKFVLNYKADPQLSDSPQEAIVSLKTDRGTTQRRFVEILDQIKTAYNDIYAERSGVTNEEWRKIATNHRDPQDRFIYEKGRGVLLSGKPEIPMNISIAEPTNSGQ